MIKKFIFIFQKFKKDLIKFDSKYNSLLEGINLTKDLVSEPEIFCTQMSM